VPHLPKRNVSAATILKWYDRHRRVLPWRALPGAYADPYAVWLSEIMLQQTTVAAVKPYFEKFLARWPTVHDLATAKTDDVMAAWAGLGYYARARNLHRCAQVVATQHQGCFPQTEAELLTLPGVGPYTAAAIAAIAFGQRAVVVDGNVERVMARVHAITEPLPRAKAKLRALADSLTPQKRCGDYAQAVMDLGATVCTPKSPACSLCPWSGACRAYQQGIAAELPRKLAKKATPTRYGVAFWIKAPNGNILLQRRPPKGLLGGMLGFPGTDWRTQPWAKSDVVKAALLSAKWMPLDGVVEHTFTHFHLKLTVWVGQLTRGQAAKRADAIWVMPAQIEQVGLPNVMQKVADLVMSQPQVLPKSSPKRARVPRRT
jgi:A/G-specific adenine glycosylase